MASFHSPTHPPRMGSSFLSRRRNRIQIRPVLRLTAALALIYVAVQGAGPVAAAVGIVMSGIVTDSSGIPVPGAFISIGEFEAAAISDGRGRFDLAGIPEGEYTLSATHLGYSPALVRNVRIRQGSVATLLIELQPRPMTLPEVPVHAPRPLLHPLAHSDIVMSRRDWEAAGARDLRDALQQIPGVTLLEGDHSARISLRGSPARAVVVDLDGVPQSNAGTGETEIGAINLHDLAAIGVEYIGGGGRVHLLTRGLEEPDTKTKRVASASLEGGSYAARGGALSLERSGSRLGMQGRVRSMAERGDFAHRLDDGSLRRRYNNDAHLLSGAGRASLHWSQGDAEAGIYGDRQERGVPGLIYSAPSPQARLTSQRTSARLSGSVTIGRVGLAASAYLLRYRGDFDSPAEQFDPTTGIIVHQFPEKNRQEGERYGIGVGGERPVAGWRLSGRYQFQLDRYIGRDTMHDEVVVGGVGLGHASRRNHHLELTARTRPEFGRWRFTLAPLAGAEIVQDEGASRYAAFTPTATAGVEREFGWGSAGITLGWGKSITAPPFNALFTVESMIAVGNRDLRPEQGEGSDLTLKARPRLAGTEINLGATAFARRTDDLIIWRRNAFGKYYPDNIARTRGRGVELSFNSSLLRGLIALNASYIHSRTRNDTPGDINRGNITPLAPTHSGSATVAIHRGGWRWSLAGRWIGRRYSTESNFDPISTAGMGLPPYSVYDLSAAYRRPVKWGSLSVEAGADNVLDRSYRVIERSPMPGRSYTIRLMAEIN